MVQEAGDNEERGETREKLDPDHRDDDGDSDNDDDDSSAAERDSD